jgi:nucleotide-binding universal stress UspA family protein
LEEAAAQLRLLGLAKVSSICVRIGDVRDSVVTEIAKQKVDAVVLGSRGHGTLITHDCARPES